MRRIFLLLLVILVIAAVDAHHKRISKSKNYFGKFQLQSKSNFRKVHSTVKSIFDKFGGKGDKSHSHSLSHSHSHSHSHSQKHKHIHKHKQSFSYSHSYSFSKKVKYYGDFNIKRQYKKEVHCAKHCVPHKAYWSGDHCACHAGLAGAGDLCCTDPNKYTHTCTVRDDPLVKSYLGQNAQVYNPCGQVLAVIHAKTSSGQSCKVTVRSADVIEQDIFVTSQVEITYQVTNNKGEFVILDGFKFYESVENKWQNLGRDYSACFTVHGEKVHVLVDKRRRVWTVDGCGTTVNFRRDTRGGKPGVCIASKNGFSQKPCDRPKDIVCNHLEEDTAPYRTKAIYYLSKSFKREEYKHLRLDCAYGKMCQRVTDAYNKCNSDRQAKALNTCSAILEVKFRSCATLPKEGKEGAELFKMFTECVVAYCKEDQSWCYREMASIAHLGCTIPGLHCCDFKQGGGGGGGGGQQKITQQRLKV